MIMIEEQCLKADGLTRRRQAVVNNVKRKLHGLQLGALAIRTHAAAENVGGILD